MELARKAQRTHHKPTVEGRGGSRGKLAQDWLLTPGLRNGRSVLLTEAWLMVVVCADAVKSNACAVCRANLHVFLVASANDYGLVLETRIRVAHDLFGAIVVDAAS